ncbi:MAG: carbohydrate binding domain-containing protein [Lentisphaeria bacterium]|nr:carbohydrate binding domain-containing protein [Lentisphaeria bacterium]
MITAKSHVVGLTAALLLLAAAGNAIAAENLIVNGDFKDGLSGWSFGKKAPAAAVAHAVKDGRLVLDIPPGLVLDAADILLIQRHALQDGQRYQLSYTVETDQPGTTRHLFQLSATPHSTLGLVENVPVQPGRNRVKTSFVALQENATPNNLTLNFSKLQGHVEISDIRLELAREYPATALSSEWLVFLDVAPETALPAEAPASLPGRGGAAVAPRRLALQDGTIDLAALAGGAVSEKQAAVLINDFVCDGPGVIALGFAADWWMDISLNGQSIYSTLKDGNRSQKFSPDDHPVTVHVDSGRNVLAVKVLAGSKGWRFVCGVPKPPIKYVANDEWRPVSMPDPVIRTGTALDLSAQVPAPAGTLGRMAIRDDGELVLAGDPATPLRLLGFNGIPGGVLGAKDDEQFRARAHEFAQAARRQGYRLFRFHSVFDRSLCEGSDGPMQINPRQLDRWDYIVHALKQEGIYCHMVVFSFSLYDAPQNRGKNFEDRDMHKLMMYLGGAWERSHFQYGAETVLNHYNPYTKLHWRDDPAIAFVEYYNEHELGFERIGAVLENYPDAKAALERRWREWLVARYDGKDLPAALATELAGASLAAAPLPIMGYRGRGTFMANEFSLLRMALSKECAAWCEGVVRGTGYSGLTTQYNVSKKIGDSAVRWEASQVIEMNTYYQHPAGGWGAPGCTVNQASSLADAANYWRNTASSRIAGRPFIVSEYNHCYWNPFQYEGGMVFGAYSALQGFHALEVHSGPVAFAGARSYVGSFSCYSSPIVRASQFLSACLFQRGDVRKARQRVELVVPEEVLVANGVADGAVSAEQSRLALITGFTIAFPWARPAAKTYPGVPPAMQILPAGIATVDAHDWFVNVVESKDGNFALGEAIAALKQRGALPANNASDHNAGIYQSDTGEVTMYSRDNRLTVVTPRSEAVSMDLGGTLPVALGAMTVLKSSVPACIAACAMRGDELTASDRIVLVYSTSVVNANTVLGPDRRLMINSGGSPVLLQAGDFALQLRHQRADRLALYALGFDGQRLQKLPVAAQDGVATVAVNTATLDTPTTFFELVVE